MILLQLLFVALIFEALQKVLLMKRKVKPVIL